MWTLLAIPFGIRLILFPEPNFVDLLMAFIPVLATIPSFFIHKFIANENREHELRHFTFAIGFSSAATSIRWTEVSDDIRYTLIVYFVAGSITLFWFTISHILENTGRFPNLHTHYGDVVVLPLTLVAISTFANEIPDEAFYFTRSIIFYVPVIVGWATLFFIAHNRFAVRTVTTHNDDGYPYISLQGSVVACAHLILLETRASSIFYILSAPVVSIVIQRASSKDSLPILFHSNIQRMLAGLYIGGILAALGYLKLGLLAFYIIPPAFFTSVNVGIHILQDRLVIPLTATVTLLLFTILVACERSDVTDYITTTLLVWFGFEFVKFTMKPVMNFQVPPDFDPNVYKPPQYASWTYPLLVFDRTLELPTRRKFVATKNAQIPAWLSKFFVTVDPSCPRKYCGVFYMLDNTLPMHLIAIHHNKWTNDGTSVMWNFKNTTRKPTPLGFVAHQFSKLMITNIREIDDKWIETISHLSILGFMPNQLYIYKKNEDEFFRVQFNKQGEIVYQYKMLRIAKLDSKNKIVLTKYYDQFMKEYENAGFIVSHPN
jgi:hypothetical protein